MSIDKKRLENKLKELNEQFKKLAEEKATLQKRLGEVEIEQIKLMGGYQHIQSMLESENKNDIK